MRNYRNFFKFLLLLSSLLLLCGWIFWFLAIRLAPQLPNEKSPFHLYATEVDDDLKRLFLEAILSAKKSIYLSIYSLNDPAITNALRKKIQEGLSITLQVDSRATKNSGFTSSDTVLFIQKKTSGLFHEKILIVDGEKIWVGSANLTQESLRLDSNLVASFFSPELGRAMQERRFCSLAIGQTHVTYFPLPEENKAALTTLLSTLDQSEKSIKIALFTLTHPFIIESIKRAHERGVKVDLTIDHKMLLGASKAAGKELLKGKFPLAFMNLRLSTFHHKIALLDDTTLIMGSTNWTKAAFEKNGECLLILDDLPKREQKSIKRVLSAIDACKEQISEDFFE